LGLQKKDQKKISDDYRQKRHSATPLQNDAYSNHA
jgi:hypothetical protein